MKYSIVTICLGNICRSPLMEALLARALRELKSGWPEGVEPAVTSAGLNPMLDFPTQEAVLTARELGVEIGGHTSRQVDRTMADGAQLFLTATFQMKGSLLTRFPDRAPGRTYAMSEFVGETGDIEDPYGRTLARYRDVAAQIERYARAAAPLILDRIREERA